MPASTHQAHELERLEQHIRHLRELALEGDVDAALEESLHLMGALVRYRHQLKRQEVLPPVVEIASP